MPQLNTFGQDITKAGGSIAPTTGSVVPSVPPALTAQFTPPPSGTQKAPAVVTSQAASDHVNNMTQAANTSLTDAQNLALHNVTKAFTPPGGTAGATGSTGTTGTTGNTPAQGTTTQNSDTSSVDSLLASMGLAGPEGEQQQNIVAQDQGAIQADQQAQQQVDDALSSMEAGTFPLTPAEQAQVNAVRGQYTNALKLAQDFATNKGLGETSLMASTGMQMYSPQYAIGQIQKAIKIGQAKVDQVNSQIVSSMSKLTTALQDSDYKAASRLYDKIGADIKVRTDEVDKINSKVFDIQKMMLDHTLKVSDAFDKVKTDVMSTLGQNNAPAAVRTAVANATDVNSVYTAAGDYLQTATGDAGAYLFAKREAQAAGVTPPDFTTWKAALDQAALNSKVAEYRAEQGIKFSYDVALEKAKQAMADAPNPDYKGQFAATIQLAAQAGGTNVQRNQIKSDLQDFIASGDYGSAYTQVLSSAGMKLTGANASNFQQQTQSYDVLSDMKTALTDLKNSGYDTNILTGGVDAIQTKIGVLMTDPQYAAVATRLNSAFQQYRVNMTGAAFGPKESAEYASVLPSSGNTFALNMAKIDGAQQYLNSVIEGTINNTVGKGGIYIKQYAEASKNAAQTQTATQDKMTAFRAADPKNEQMVQELHSQFPTWTLDQISQQLGL